MSASVRLENLTLSYDRHPAIHHMDGTFNGGSLTAVTGPNGAGKSTLLKAIAGIVSPSDGRIMLQGIAVHEVAYLPQVSAFEKDFPISVLQMVSLGLWNLSGSMGRISKAMLSKAADALGAVGLEGFEHRQTGTLSPGQLQRAFFARLLLQDAKLILLDEPFAAVDSDTAAKLMTVIRQWHAEGRTILCVLHDLEQIRQYFPECLLLARECIAWGPTAGILTPQHLNLARLFREAWQQAPEVCQQ